MLPVSENMINNIAQTLLHVGERVMCLSKERMVIDVWDRNDSALTDSNANYKGKQITDITNDTLIDQCQALVDEAIDTNKDARTECLYIKHNIPASYSVRILHTHADETILFIVFERLENSKVFSLLEDKWKLALDASGDGMWEMNMQTKEIYFSDKWHELFGYTIDDIKNTDDWLAKLHTDDLPCAQNAMEWYMAGRTPSYSAELRYKQKDGTYKWILSRGIIVSKTTDGCAQKIIGTHTDINKRKLAELAHQSTLQLLTNLIDNLQDGILVIEGTKVLFANQAYCNVYGITATPGDLNRVTAENTLAYRQSRVKNGTAFAQRITELGAARAIALNDEIELLDGRIYSRDYVPITLPDNKEGEIWKFRKITEQKQSQARFEEQRLFYERILNSIPADIAVHDAQHKFLFVNPSAIKDVELRKYLIGKNHEDYFRYRGLPLTLADERNRRFEKVINEKRPIEFEEKIVNREGKVSYHLRCLSPLFNDEGDIDLVIVYGVNITDRIITEQALKKSRDTFASAFTHSGVGMALLSRAGNWLEVNTAICNITGYTKEELLQLTFQDITYPEDLEADLEQLNKLLNNEISTYTLEKRYISKSNKIVWVSLTVSFVKDTNDSEGFFISQIVDITAKKTLADEIYSKNTELEATKISLINRIKQMDELTHIIGHNLRGPAGNIRMLSDKNYIDQEEGEAGKDLSLGLIHQSSIALIDSLNTLMEMAMIKLNDGITFDNCNIADIVNNISSQLHGMIYEQGAVIDLHTEVEDIPYPRVYMESILYNLISNALKYATKDKQPHIVVSTYMVGDSICLSVKDNGIGIDMERYGDQVFKLNQIFHEGYDSKGVGLFITKTQIESLGGSIELKSKQNEGSEFIVKF